MGRGARLRRCDAHGARRTDLCRCRAQFPDGRSAARPVRRPLGADHERRPLPRRATFIVFSAICPKMPISCRQPMVSQRQSRGRRTRLARQIGVDARDVSAQALDQLAAFFAEAQLREIYDGASLALSETLLSKTAPIVGAGAGRFVIERLAARLGRRFVDFADLLPVGTGCAAKPPIVCRRVPSRCWPICHRERSEAIQCRATSCTDLIRASRRRVS